MEYDNEEDRKLHNETSINFTVNFPEYMDIAILNDFNIWIKRYVKDIDDDNQYITLKDDQKLYFINSAIPYIDLKSGKNELLWRVPINTDLTPIDQKITQVFDEIKTLL